MPPKAKYTKEEIVKVAFDMTREKGFESVTARELGKRLGTSATPIFTAFQNMHELQQEVRKLARKEFESYVADVMNYTPAFKRYGIQMIQFARQEPHLFRLLYMGVNEESQPFEEMLKELGETVPDCMEFVQKDYNVSGQEAEILFRQAWIHTFSICVLIVNKICRFSDQEIMEMLGMEFQGTWRLLKEKKYQEVDAVLKQ